MRIFIAIDINKKMREEVGILQNRIRTKARLDKFEASWVKPEQMHLTLKFLGEVEEEKIEEVNRIAAEVAAAHTAFSVDIRQVGTFGRPIKIVWLGMGERSRELKNLQKDLDDRYVAIGFPKEDRDFTGHLTLCRIKTFKASRIVEPIVQKYADTQLGNQEVAAVCVYKSELTPDGPVYTLLQKSELRTQNSE